MNIINVPQAKDPRGHHICFRRHKITGQLHFFVDDEVIESGDLVCYDGSDDLCTSHHISEGISQDGFHSFDYDA
jgi:hypothetical protein